jgi:anti-sigma B factor antagonist
VADFALRVEQRNGATVLTVLGSVDLTTAPELRERLVDLIAEGHLDIVTDLSGTDFLDSTGLGALVGAMKRLRTRDGTMRLVCPAGPVRKVFSITSLDRVFPIHESVDDALG